MYFKLCLFAICVYGVCSEPVSVPVADPKSKCLNDFNVVDNLGPISDFYKHGKLQPGYEHLKCFFNCYETATGVADKKGVPVLRLKQAGPVISRVLVACASYKDLSTPCDTTFSYLTCIIGILNTILGDNREI